jgi:tetratricopeptide (TPR) repeat protein
LNTTTLLNTLHSVLLVLRDFSAYTTMFLFVVFGTWTLHKRFQKHEEWSLRSQSFVLLGVALFYLLEIPTLRFMMHESIVQFIFTLLGLLVAGLALYGHIAVSLISRLMVEFLIPDNPAAAATPRLGPAEALERQGDWEGALQEYYILARIYPRNAMLCVRSANNLLHLNRSEEAVPWFERAIKYTDKPEDTLALVRRLCDTLETLHQPDKARAALQNFAERFAGHETARQVADELQCPGAEDNKPTPPPSDMLVLLEDAPLTPDDRG